MMGRTIKYIHPSVITCHDILPFKYKKNHSLLSEYYRRKQIESMTYASFIIFVSKHSRNDFLELFNYNESKTKVIYEGVSEIFKVRDKTQCRKELGLPLDRPLVLHVGTEAPRKNPVTLFKIINHLKKNIPNILLIRVGRRHSKTRKITDSLYLPDNIFYTGNLPEENLAKLYNASDIFLFPSFYEGFGLPILEALKSGCPVVASDASSIPEITGNAAFLQDPLDVDSFVINIENLLNSDALKQEFIHKGLLQAKKYNWETTAVETLKVYDQVISTHI